ELYPGASLVGHSFRAKLVRKPILDAQLHIAHDDHLRGLVALDLFLHVLAGEAKLLDNLRFILERARERNPRPLLTLPLILVGAGWGLRELGPAALDASAVAQRAASGDTRPDPALVARPPEPFYLGVAMLVREQVGAARYERLAQAKSLVDVQALLF